MTIQYSSFKARAIGIILAWHNDSGDLRLYTNAQYVMFYFVVACNKLSEFVTNTAELISTGVFW